MRLNFELVQVFEILPYDKSETDLPCTMNTITDDELVTQWYFPTLSWK